MTDGRPRNSGQEVPHSAAFRRQVANAVRAAEFEAREFAGVPVFHDQPNLLEASIRAVDPALGCWVELGFGSAESALQIRAIAARAGLAMTLHGFDSFEGLPEDWGGEAKKHDYRFARPHLDLPDIRVHEGWFHESIPRALPELAGRIGFVHVDCDLYSSTRTAFELLGERLGPGTVIQFDEYWNYLEAEDGELRAFREFLTKRDLGFRYLGYNANYMQASVLLET
ncbi:class I SAM-dependent methyltransferase [Streptosporangium sp. NBC_01755]|uniref:class I SAM-dependent methyltransferase n=1 Tax=unclassified Streptosporangium TaxID=2632669 RepID=UPI002DDB0A8D|nr:MULTISPECIES: class I SAM-dependent methyltransferase [unclassified Streptosporangium]WSA23261.1 class I SAM-dependent methyltransferase [Streptosporangium sp. NBC_01810]WSC98601.1 class I SAM-dependent methyltransferase [Streptosporangium sp. NBC_01755]